MNDKTKYNKDDFYQFYYCVNCYFYDGYDVCCHKKNFGAVVDTTIETCKKMKLYKHDKK